jgi:small subunit ribosomal protein S20
MPILKHAKKKLKQDKKRTVRNKKVKDLFKKLVKTAKVEKTAESLSKAFSAVDKAAKKNIIPANRAARMKSSLSKIVEGKLVVAAPHKALTKKKAAAVKKATIAKATKSKTKKKK